MTEKELEKALLNAKKMLKTAKNKEHRDFWQQIITFIKDLRK